ncbi:hypothetical protein B0H10DRAFT_2000458 [Mycena sp. CBHHK59/15]|nr:hypothetical protein B0H10DRAFT_2000458 [Mycena sp. CBHHK59/15]
MPDALTKISPDDLGVPEEIISLASSSSLGIDIHDANRKKIVIGFRPRCTDYARKKRSTIRTLTSLASCTTDPKSDCPQPTVPNADTDEKKDHKLRSRVVSGRIEKPARVPSQIQTRKPDLPVDASSMVTVVAHLELYSCGCATPAQCRQCTLRRLADKFCAIVAARKEKYQRSSMPS